MSSRQSRLSTIPAGERIFAQIPVFICLPCLFWYPPDNVQGMSGTGKCWGVSAQRWDEGWLYYHFKCSACRVLRFRSSLTCQAALTGSHRSPVLPRAPLSPLFWMTAGVTSSSSSTFPTFLPSLPTPCAKGACAGEGMSTRCSRSRDRACLGCGRLVAGCSLLSESASSAPRTAPRPGRRRETPCSSLCLQRRLWGEGDRP